MRSIFLMPSDALAGDAKRRVPLPWRRRQMRSIFLMPSDALAGDAALKIWGRVWYLQEVCMIPFPYRISRFGIRKF